MYDDQNDYFDLNSKWLSEKEKDEASKKRSYLHANSHKSRRDMKLALNFASRTVSVNNGDHQKYKDNLMIGVNKLLDSTEKRFPKNLFDGDKGQLITEIVTLVSFVFCYFNEYLQLIYVWWWISR